MELISDSFRGSVELSPDNAPMPKTDLLSKVPYNNTNVRRRRRYGRDAVQILAIDTSGTPNNNNVEESGNKPEARKSEKSNSKNRERNRNKRDNSENSENNADKEEEGESDTEQDCSHEKIQKYLIICLPYFSSHQMEHLEISQRVVDDKLVKVIKKKYQAQRPTWKRLISLRGFSTIRLVRVGTTFVHRTSNLLIGNSSNLLILERGFFQL